MLLYTPASKGYSFNAFFDSVRTTGTEFFVLVRCKQDRVFGAYISNLFQDCGQQNNRRQDLFVADYDAFVFTLVPKFEIFPLNIQKPKAMVMMTEKHGLCIGDSQVMALHLDPDMRSGTSHSATCFSNPSLTNTDQNGRFEVVSVECWGLQSKFQGLMPNSE